MAQLPLDQKPPLCHDCVFVVGVSLNVFNLWGIPSVEQSGGHFVAIQSNLLLTCKHVIIPKQYIAEPFSLTIIQDPEDKLNGKIYYNGKDFVVYQHKSSDVCILQFKNKIFDGRHFAKFYKNYDEIIKYLTKNLNTLHLIGHPTNVLSHGKQNNGYEIIIDQVKKISEQNKTFVPKAIIAGPGSFGCAIYDNNETMLGIILRGVTGSNTPESPIVLMLLFPSMDDFENATSIITNIKNILGNKVSDAKPYSFSFSSSQSNNNADNNNANNNNDADDNNENKNNNQNEDEKNEFAGWKLEPNLELINSNAIDSLSIQNFEGENGDFISTDEIGKRLFKAHREEW